MKKEGLSNTKPKKKRKQKKKKRFFFNCCAHSVKSETDDPEEEQMNKLVNPQVSNIDNIAQKHEVIVTYQRKTYYVMSPRETSTESISNIELRNREPKLEIEYYESDEEEKACTIKSSEEENKNENNKEEKEKLVKTILSKYLEIRKAEADALTQEIEEKKETEPQQKNVLTLKDVSINSSSDSLEIVPVNSFFDLSKCKIDFPVKSKSAPTNFESYDGLADICLKLYELRQQETSKSNSCDTFNNTNSKKKLELIFTKSLDEISSKQDKNSIISLDYKISCEGTPVITGTLKTENVLYQSDIEDFESDSMTITSEFTSQEQDLDSFKSRSHSNEDSNSSLTWKLIISHHGHGGDIYCK